MDMFRACLTAAVRPTLPAAASAAPTLAQRPAQLTEEQIQDPLRTEDDDGPTLVPR